MFSADVASIGQGFDELPPEHGGDLHRAAARFNLPLSDWLDLSAALNPCPYPAVAFDSSTLQRLPADLDELLAAARDYYGCSSLVAMAGSQAAIQWLPLLRPQCRVAVPAPGYREHVFRWRWAGHEVVTYAADDYDAIERAVDGADVAVVINPHNPTGGTYPPEQLRRWWHRLRQRGGWLIVDEAFVDTRPALSLAGDSNETGLIVLRSLGKFFGLPGLRCGFALCEPALAARLAVAAGPWPLSGPTVAVATHALRDGPWQATARIRLAAARDANAALLREMLARWRAPPQVADLFISASLPGTDASALQERLAHAGVWIRLITPEEICALPAAAPHRSLLRWGLVDPATPAWQRYCEALASCSPDQ